MELLPSILGHLDGYFRCGRLSGSCAVPHLRDEFILGLRNVVRVRFHDDSHGRRFDHLLHLLQTSRALQIRRLQLAKISFHQISF